MSPVRSGYAGLHLAYDPDERSAFGARQERAGGAAGVSLAAHILFLLVTSLIVTRPAPSGISSTPDEAAARPELVWFAIPGSGGGGGGGGNRTPAPAARLQTTGLDVLSVPVAAQPPLTPPRDQLEPRADPPEIALNVSVKPMDAGQLAMMGAVEGSRIAPPASRGSGSEGGAGSGRNGGSGPGDGSGLDDGTGGGTGGGDAHEIGNGITPPTVIRNVKPAYTPDALKARIQGDVQVRAIVRPDGTASDIRVIHSLDRWNVRRLYSKSKRLAQI